MDMYWFGVPTSTTFEVMRYLAPKYNYFGLAEHGITTLECIEVQPNEGTRIQCPVIVDHLEHWPRTTQLETVTRRGPFKMSLSQSCDMSTEWRHICRESA
jgi:hypothetical protein